MQDLGPAAGSAGTRQTSVPPQSTMAPNSRGAASGFSTQSMSSPEWLARFEAALNDPRDTAMLSLMLQCGIVASLGVSLFFVPPGWLRYAAPAYWVLMLVTVLDRFTLMLHCTSHRQLFRRNHPFLNQTIPWLLGPFFGQTPNTYFAHHLGMHHREENLVDDTSSTMRFRRDRFDHWFFGYYLRFMVFGLVELCLYFYKRRKFRLLSRVVVGEGAYFAAAAALFSIRPGATLVVFLFPLVLVRTLMMMGNWTQHAFVNRACPEDPFGASITTINTRYNRRCFNDGYHVLHHINPRCHWTEHPAEFERALSEYGAHDAIVFDGLDYFQIWLCMMTRRWGILADSFVHLQGAPSRNREQVIALLKNRVLPAV